MVAHQSSSMQTKKIISGKRLIGACFENCGATHEGIVIESS